MESTKTVKINICVKCRQEVPDHYDFCKECCIHNFTIKAVINMFSGNRIHYEYLCHGCGDTRIEEMTGQELTEYLKKTAPVYTTMFGNKVVK